MKTILFVLLLFSAQSAKAIYTELGLSYNYKKSFFDKNNNTEMQSGTFSLSFYLWDHIAIETSYTNGLYVKKERQSGTDPNIFTRTTTQYSDIYGCDLIYVFADKKDKWQPFIKGGAAYIKKRQVVQDISDTTSNPSWEIKPDPGMAPSYGIGLKYFLTEAIALRANWDVLQTPIDDSTKIEDFTGRLGLSWMF